jgi:TfoX/Sxy family transcriptional regulator of competence genes
MMAYNEHLADRIRRELKDQNASFEEKKMFGGICFMVDDKMCVGVIKDDLMARVHPEEVEPAALPTGSPAHGLHQTPHERLLIHRRRRNRSRR